MEVFAIGEVSFGDILTFSFKASVDLEIIRAASMAINADTR